MKNYIIIGGSELQKDFIEKVKENEFIAHVIDYDPSCIGAKIADHFHCISIDDLSAVLELAKSLNIAGISTVATEQGNITANYVAEELGLATNGLEAALNTTDKARMKKVLRSHNIATPLSTEVRSEQELLSLNAQYPLIVKASDRSAGRGVALAKNAQELLSYYREAVEVSFNKLVLVEEYVDAPQYSIETISSQGQHQIVAITQMGFSGPPHFVETTHRLPALLSKQEMQLISQFAFDSLKAFDIKYGACHIEVRMPGKPTMIEIASRMGGWRHWMVESALSVDYLQLILDASLGKPITFQANTEPQSAIVRTIFGLKDYHEYLERKEKNTNFVIDLVKQGQPSSDATNLIEAHGFYITLEDSEK